MTEYTGKEDDIDFDSFEDDIDQIPVACPDWERAKQRSREIHFSNTPVPRGGADIHEVVCTTNGNSVSVKWQVRSSYNTSVVLRSGEDLIECEFDYKQLEPLVWKNEEGYVYPKDALSAVAS